MGVGGQCPMPAAWPPSKKELVPIVQEAWWAPRTVRTVAENLIPTRTQSPECPARSKSLYWPLSDIHTYERQYMLWSFSLKTHPEIIIIDAELTYVIFSLTYFLYKKNYLHSLEMSLVQVSMNPSSAKKWINYSNATSSRMTTYRIIFKSSLAIQLSPHCMQQLQSYKCCTILVKFFSLSLHLLNYHW